jgi:hypothetical protein
MVSFSLILLSNLHKSGFRFDFGNKTLMAKQSTDEDSGNSGQVSENNEEESENDSELLVTILPYFVTGVNVLESGRKPTCSLFFTECSNQEIYLGICNLRI